MKKLIRLCTILLCLVLAMNLSTEAMAAGSVTYRQGAERFIFAPGTTQSPTSIFSDFQNVMPGDSITQSIFVRNLASNKVKVRIYMRSLGAQLGTNEFLNQMTLKVEKQDDTILFDAPADQPADLTNWAYLGTLYSGGQLTLDVTLDVPITMGNEFQDQVGYLDWEFMVVELPISPDDPAKTGDTSNVGLYAALMGVSLAAIIILIVAKKRKKKDET